MKTREMRLIAHRGVLQASRVIIVDVCLTFLVHGYLALESNAFICEMQLIILGHCVGHVLILILILIL